MVLFHKSPILDAPTNEIKRWWIGWSLPNPSTRRHFIEKLLYREYISGKSLILLKYQILFMVTLVVFYIFDQCYKFNQLSLSKFLYKIINLIMWSPKKNVLFFEDVGYEPHGRSFNSCWTNNDNYADWHCFWEKRAFVWETNFKKVVRII